MAKENETPKENKITVSQIVGMEGYAGFEAAPLAIRDSAGRLHPVKRFAFEQDVSGRKVIVMGAKEIDFNHNDVS